VKRRRNRELRVTLLAEERGEDLKGSRNQRSRSGRCASILAEGKDLHRRGKKLGARLASPGLPHSVTGMTIFNLKRKEKKKKKKEEGKLEFLQNFSQERGCGKKSETAGVKTS